MFRLAVSAILLMLISPTFAGQRQSTSFRGVHLGMAKAELLSMRISNLTPEDKGDVVLLRNQSDECGRVTFSNGGATELKLYLCFFDVDKMELKDFAQQIVNAYNISSLEFTIDQMKLAPTSNIAIRTEMYVGNSPLNEKVQVSQNHLTVSGSEGVEKPLLTVRFIDTGSFN